LNSDQVIKFNEKVRRANKHLSKRKRSKGKKTTREEKADHSRSRSKNASLARLKDRKLKHIVNSNKITDKDYDSDREEKYNPRSRGIGMDFLEFVKRKPNKNNTKLFLSTQKTGSDWGNAYKLDKSKRKIRPNSAQNYDYKNTELKALNDVIFQNEDLDQNIEKIEEQPDENVTNRVSDEFLINRDGNNQKDSPNVFEPVRKLNVKITPMHAIESKEEEKNNHISLEKDYYAVNEPTFKKKRKSRSKNRQQKRSEERNDRKS
jgi:hypothetical protein